MKREGHGARFRILLVVSSVSLGLFGAFAASAPAQSYVFGRADFSTGNNPSAIATGDFNADGKLDLAIANASDNTVSILLGKPDGTFAPQVPYAVGVSPVAVSVGDFNGDGKLDLAVVNRTDDTISILLGNGDGTFQAEMSLATGGGAPSALVVGDFNGDGISDLAVSNSLAGVDTVGVLIGNGDGTFKSAVTYAVGLSPFSVTAADFNSDGKLDLAVATDTTVSILLGNGDGTFQTQVQYTTATQGPFGSIVAGNFTGDGKISLAVVSSSDNVISVLLGNGDGTFQGHVDYPVLPAGAGLVVGDFNGDGKLDLAQVRSTTLLGPFSAPLESFLSILLGNGDGTFQAAVNYDINRSSGGALAAGDFNGDGKLDVAALESNAVSVVLGKGDGTFPTHTDYGAAGNPFGVAIGDFNEDGKPDLAVADNNSSPATVSILLANGNGTFQAPVSYSTAGNGFPTAVVVADFNRDGHLDLAVANSNSGGVSILLGNGDGTFQPAVCYEQAGGSSTLWVAIGDFNGDGILDLATSFGILLGNGDGTFRLPSGLSGPGGRSGVVGDFNGDGKLDLATVDGSVLSVFLGNGDGTLQTAVTYTTGADPVYVTGGDFNGDGKFDLATANANASAVSVLLGNGNGTFQTHVDYGVGLVPFNVTAMDLNGDGKLDLLTANQDSNTVSVLFGNGDGTFQPKVERAAGNTPTGIAAADLDGNGTTDVVTANYGDGTVSVLLNLPVVAAFPGQLTFANQAVGSTSAAQTITLTNSGAGPVSVSSVAAAGDFAETNTCASSLAVGSSCTVSVTFTPTSTGIRTGSLTITDSAPASFVIPLSGTSGALASLSPATVNFGTSTVGVTTQPQIVTITNSGDTNLTFTSGFALAGVDSGDYHVCFPMFMQGVPCFYAGIADCGLVSSLVPGGSCTVGLAFDPTAAGTRTATLSFFDDAPGSPQVVPLTGVGAAQAPVVSLSPASLTFGNQLVGTGTPEQRVTLTNTGSASLSITSIAVSGDFIETNLCKSPIAVGASCTISVLFKPAATGTLTGAVTITDNAAGSPQTVSLTGTGTAPTVSLSSTSLSFAAEDVGVASIPTAVTVTNSGTAALAITSVKVAGSNAGDFSESNNCPSSLPVSSTCSISVSFKPAAGGSRSGTLTITDNASGGSQTVKLAGTGLDFSLAAVGSASATVSPGQTATYTIAPAGVSGFTGTVAFTCGGAPSEATCTVSPASVLIPAPGMGVAQTSAAVTVTTTAPSLVSPLRWPRVLLPPPGAPSPLLSLVLLALMMLAALAAAPKWRTRRASLAFAAMMLMVVLWASCGGGSSGTAGNPGTPAGTYTVTVTGTFTGSATLTHTTKLTLIVQ
ncbi:MAG TPA: FG-GAP-like repeat-containing protein [Terriglobia bacterium]|nr:FG-GAP-like repeat-containing protein [Terriglobia bacterium]